MRWGAVFAAAAHLSAIKRDPNRFAYTDLALTPVTDDETETRELFNTVAAQAYVGQQRQLEKAVKSGAYAPAQARKPEPLVAAK